MTKEEFIALLDEGWRVGDLPESDERGGKAVCIPAGFAREWAEHVSWPLDRKTAMNWIRQNWRDYLATD